MINGDNVVCGRKEEGFFLGGIPSHTCGIVPFNCL